MDNLNLCILQGYIYNIQYWENLHLIKFDIWQYKTGKGKRLAPLRLCCEMWNMDRLLKDLQEGACYSIAGELREYKFEKNDGTKHKYALQVKHIKELKKVEKENKEKEIITDKDIVEEEEF